MNDKADPRTTQNLVEAILFWKGEPLTAKEIAKILKSDEATVKLALEALAVSLKDRGIVLQETRGDQAQYSLGTCPEASQLIEGVTKEELSKDLGKASLETLSIILYKGPVKRSEIDNVRGVNSSFILRNLLIRGLITKKPSPTDIRTSVYEASVELLSYLGVTSLEALPNFSLVKEELSDFYAKKEIPNINITNDN
jgi:segregation and condensation protein B